MSKKKFDLCGYCCKWANDMDGKSPVTVADTYPKVMRKVLMKEFGFPKKVADDFIAYACYGNWDRFHSTSVEGSAKATEFADVLIWDVFYCSDRWSWDRVIRVQWTYMALRDKLREVLRDE